MREKLQKMSLLLINLKKGLPAAFNPLPCFSLPSSVLFLWIFFLVNKKICVNCYIPRPFEFFLLCWRKNCSGYSFATLPPFQFSIDYIIMNDYYLNGLFFIGLRKQIWWKGKRNWQRRTKRNKLSFPPPFGVTHTKKLICSLRNWKNCPPVNCAFFVGFSHFLWKKKKKWISLGIKKKIE